MKDKLPFRTDFDVPEESAVSGFPTGRPELWCLGVSGVLGIVLANFLLFGGFQLGFALVAAAMILFNAIYLLCRGHRLTPYSSALLALSLVICGSFARADDGFVKFIMLQFLAVSAGLGLCLLAGKNRWNVGKLSSLLDAFRVLFGFPLGQIGESARGLRTARKRLRGAGKKQGAVLAGLAAAVPLLALVIPLLMRSDAAFEGLMSLLPDFDFAELFVSLAVGLPAAWVLYTGTIALHHIPKVVDAEKARKNLPVATVNAVLGALCGVYFLYLFSQLAYVFGGLFGILPEEYTFAQYARRGFFEMAWLCGINLTVIALAVAFTQKQGKIVRSTRWLCLFIGLVTLFFVVAACAKMLLYIDVYGLTRLRLLTQVILVFLGIATILVCVWLFAPKFPYMKPVLLAALILGAGIAWADLDTVVATYNVNGYLAGRLETVDTSYLGSLGTGVVPQLVRLKEEAPDAVVASQAQRILYFWDLNIPADFREWNYSNHVAKKYLSEEPQETPPDMFPEVEEEIETVPIPGYPDSLGIHAIAPAGGCICLSATEARTGKPVWYLYMANGELMGPFETETAMLDLFPGNTQLVWMALEETEIWTQATYRSFRGRSPDGKVLFWLMNIGASITHGPMENLEEYMDLCKKLGLEPPPSWLDSKAYAAG